jgi:hypothetical protein
MATETNTGLFSEEDQYRLEESYKYRKKILEEAFRDGDIPRDPKEIEAVNNVLNSMDKAIYDKAQAKLKYQDTQNKEATLQMVAATLKSVQEQKLQHQGETILEAIVDETPLEVVKDELSIGVDQIPLNEILNEDEE